MSLWKLCLDGKVAKMRAALNRGENVNVRNSMNKTVLMCAAQENKILILKLLLEQPSIEVNLGDDGGFTALHKATISGSTDSVKLLLADRRVDINCKNSFNETPLIIAASIAGSFDIVKLLLDDNRVDVNCAALTIPCGPLFTPLMYATMHSNFEAAKLLLDDPRVDVNWMNNSRMSALHVSVTKNSKTGFQKGHLELYLAHPRVDVNCKRGPLGTTVLHMDVINNHLEAVKMILAEPRFTSANALREPEGLSAVGLAAVKGHWDVLKELVHHPSVDLAVSGLGPDDLAR